MSQKEDQYITTKEYYELVKKDLEHALNGEMPKRQMGEEPYIPATKEECIDYALEILDEAYEELMMERGGRKAYTRYITEVLHENIYWDDLEPLLNEEQGWELGIDPEDLSTMPKKEKNKKLHAKTAQKKAKEKSTESQNRALFKLIK